jgi:hypothetical protein
MAKKILLMRLVQEIHGYAQVTNRRPSPRPPALYLLQLREKAARAHAGRRPQRVSITTDWQNSAEVALPVRINHRPAGRTDIPVVIG